MAGIHENEAADFLFLPVKRLEQSGGIHFLGRHAPSLL